MVLICVAAILCIAAFNGMKKGAIRMAASLVAMIITIAVTTFASPIVRMIRIWTSVLHRVYMKIS